MKILPHDPRISDLTPQHIRIFIQFMKHRKNPQLQVCCCKAFFHARVLFCGFSCEIVLHYLTVLRSLCIDKTFCTILQFDGLCALTNVDANGGALIQTEALPFLMQLKKSKHINTKIHCTLIY